MYLLQGTSQQHSSRAPFMTTDLFSQNPVSICYFYPNTLAVVNSVFSHCANTVKQCNNVQLKQDIQNSQQFSNVMIFKHRPRHGCWQCFSRASIRLLFLLHFLDSFAFLLLGCWWICTQRRFTVRLYTRHTSSSRYVHRPTLHTAHQLITLRHFLLIYLLTDMYEPTRNQQLACSTMFHWLTAPTNSYFTSTEIHTYVDLSSAAKAANTDMISLVFSTYTVLVTTKQCFHTTSPSSS